MKNFTSFLIASLIFIANYSQACSCSSVLNFCESVNSDSKVVQVEVMEKYDATIIGSFMDVKIIEEIQGQVVEEMITIVNYGTSCDIFFDGFQVGDKIITKYNELKTPIDIANFSMIHFSACTTGFLNLNNGLVTGNIDGDESSKSYDDFKNDIDQCSDLTLFDRNPEQLENYIHTFPNPTSDFLTIYTPTLNPSEITIELYSTNGQFIFTENNITTTEYRIDISEKPVGVYFLKIRYRENTIVRKIVKR